MKKLMIIPLLFCIFTSGCNDAERLFENRHEIETLDFVRGMGIDAIDDKLRVSVILERKVESSGQEKSPSDEKSHSEVYFMDGNSISEALKNIDSISDKHLFLGQMNFIILGDAASRSNIIKLIDFPTRDDEIRLISNIYVSNGKSAFDFFTKATKLDNFIGKKLANLEKHEISDQYVVPINLLNIISGIDNDFSGFVIPSISLASDNDIEQGNLQLNPYLDGYAVFKNQKLSTYVFDKEVLYGMNILNNKVESGQLNVKIINNISVGLEVLNIEPKIKSIFIGIEPELYIETHVESNLSELQNSVNIFNTKDFDLIDKEQESYITRCLEKAINFSQENNVDILGLADVIHRQHPYKWETIKERWDKIFPQIPFHIKVKSQIRRTFDIRQTQGTRVEK